MAPTLQAAPPRYARNFFGGNNCVAEYGNFPSNFLLGVSTPGNDIQSDDKCGPGFGDPITVAESAGEIRERVFEARMKPTDCPDFPSS